jgi:type IV secretory pathway VirB4 component
VAVQIEIWPRHLFDIPQDTLTFSRFQTFNFDGSSDYTDILERLLFYVLQRASSEVEKPQNTATLKMFVIDEAWIFLKNKTIRDWSPFSCQVC